MHEYTMNVIGEYIKNNYDPETMTCSQLEELSKLSDIFKDMLTGDYYYTIIEAMHKNSDSENEEYMSEYAPETTRYYTPTDFRKRMYYSEMDDTWGKSYKSRSKYLTDIESKSDDVTTTKDLDEYMADLKDDITEMTSVMNGVCKQSLKQKLINLATAIV